MKRCDKAFKQQLLTYLNSLYTFVMTSVQTDD